jgi:hypothetical protein
MTEEIRAPRRPVSPPQRVATALLDRRWVTLFAELVLIVAGILIALAIDGWVQNQRDRETEVVYLLLLSEDLVQIEESLQDYVDFETANTELAASAYEAIAERNLPGDADQIRALLSGMGTRRTLSIDSAAYTDLLSTGNLQLIASQDLRQKIVQYFASIERAEVVIANNNAAFVDGIYFGFMLDRGITPIVQTSATSLIQESNNLMRRLLGDGVVLPRDKVLERPSGNSSWDDIRRHVIFRMRIAALGSILGGQMIDASRELRGEIEKELARRDSH